MGRAALGDHSPKARTDPKRRCFRRLVRSAVRHGRSRTAGCTSNQRIISRLGNCFARFLAAEHAKLSTWTWSPFAFKCRQSMKILTAGSLPLFRISGIQVHLHWTWLVVAYLEIVNRGNEYRSMTWNVLEYLAIFGIVLLHEFGHALACRQVGGQANRIMLWPLGGVAFVQPPPRPGALLWTIAAGPLVNVILLPVTVAASLIATGAGLENEYPDFTQFLFSIAVINLGLLIFNMLPIYPLDGGQILQAVLWFAIGRARSLMVSAIIGLVGAAGLSVLALVLLQDEWLALVGIFVAWQACQGFNLGVRLHGLQPTLNLLNEGLSALRSERHDDAVELLSKVIAAGGEPGMVATAHTNRGLVETRRGNWQTAIEDYREALRLQPELASAQNNLAWLLAACPVDELRNGQGAVEQATWACNVTGWRNPSFIGTLAAACAEVGDFVEAVRWQKRALADPAYRQMYGDATVSGRLRLYEQGLPCRLPLHED